MLKYSAYILRQLRRDDVTVSRPARKAIFSHRLWCPRRVRERRSVSVVLMTSYQCSPSRQCIWSPSIANKCLSSSLSYRSLSPSQTVSCIPTIVGNRPNCLSRRNECRVSCLQSVRRTALIPPVNVGVLNARSVHVNSASICDWISSSNLRLAAVVETWHNSRDCPDLIACTPPGFNYIERARPREDADDANMLTNHGGVCSITAPYIRNESLSLTILRLSTLQSTSLVQR